MLRISHIGNTTISDLDYLITKLDEATHLINRRDV